jgi:long-chain fatty acid transport protein
MKFSKLLLAMAASGIATSAFATNGMNLEGYGPIAAGMGGASMAYDNGTAGAINNPATLAMTTAAGMSRLDLAVGMLGPDVSTTPSAGGSAKKSDADAYYMPAAGYVTKKGNMTYGVALMAQGGMGTDYSTGDMWGTYASMDGSGGTDGSTDGNTYDWTTANAYKNMSEVGVGRLMLPIASEVNDRLTLGGSIDYVWSGMDIKWLVDGAHFGDMMTTRTKGIATGSMVTGFQAMMGATTAHITEVGYGYFNAANDNKFTQRAKGGSGFGGNIGFTYKASPKLTLGGVYHSKVALGDMATGDTEATLEFGVRMDTTTNEAVPVVGKITVKDFKWPETFGLGFAYQANDRLTVVGDYKRINWADVMRALKMNFTAAAAGSQTGSLAPGFGSTSMDMEFFQNWEDQNVFMLGGSYKVSEPLTLRLGVNVANNPIPDGVMSPLFPAIVKTHYTGGIGYALDKSASVDFSLTYAPEASVTNNWSSAGGANQTTTHSQTNWQLMYSKRF